jgi:putative MFS transporter
MALGATLGGLLADRFGRRQVFALTLLIFGLATGAAALSWSVGALLVFRFLIGLGLGAELPVASTLVSEYAPARVRGRVVVLLEAFWAVGWTLSALIGYFVVPGSDSGWRWALAIGALPALYAVVVRRGLPESVRFLEARGRVEEAEAAVRRFERAADVEPVESPIVPVTRPPGPRALWAAGSRARTAALWAVWFCINFSYYGAFIWLPTLLFDSGFTLVKSFEFTLIITLAQLPGYAVAAVLIEKWGRRPTLAAFLLGSAAGAAMFAGADGDTAVLVTGMVLSFFNLGAWGALYAVTPEVYPTVLRATGAGAAAGFGRLASIAAPLCVPPLLGAGGSGLVFGVFAAFFLLGAVATWWLPERRGQALDDVIPTAVGAGSGRS